MYRGFLADCPGGKMVPATFCQIYAKCFPGGRVKEFCDHVFRTFDIDRNGVIDFKEFLLSIDVNSSGSPEEKLNWAFRWDLHQGVSRTQCSAYELFLFL